MAGTPGRRRQTTMMWQKRGHGKQSRMRRGERLQRRMGAYFSENGGSVRGWTLGAARPAADVSGRSRPRRVEKQSALPVDHGRVVLVGAVVEARNEPAATLSFEIGSGDAPLNHS